MTDPVVLKSLLNLDQIKDIKRRTQLRDTNNERDRGKPRQDNRGKQEKTPQPSASTSKQPTEAEIDEITKTSGPSAKGKTGKIITKMPSFNMNPNWDSNHSHVAQTLKDVWIEVTNPKEETIFNQLIGLGYSAKKLQGVFVSGELIYTFFLVISGTLHLEKKIVMNVLSF